MQTSVPPASNPRPESSAVSAQPGNRIDVLYSVFLSGDVGTLNSLRHQVQLNITATIPTALGANNIVSALVIANNVRAQAPSGVNISVTNPRNIPSFVASSTVGRLYQVNFTLPDAPGTFRMNVNGTISEYSVLGEGGAEVPYDSVSTSFSSTVATYNLLIKIPAGLRLLTVYSFSKGLSFINSVPYQIIRLSDGEYVTSQFFELAQGALGNRVITLLYAGNGVYVSAAGLVLILVLGLLAPFWAQSAGRLMAPLKVIIGRLQRVTPKQLFALFVILALLTVSLSFVVGPDPRPKVYVIASANAAATVNKFILNSTAFVPVLPQDAEQNSATISSVGTFSAIVVAAPKIDLGITPYATGDVAITLASNRHVIVVKSYSSQVFIDTAEQLYKGSLQVVNGPREMVSALNAIQIRQNPFGVTLSHQVFHGFEIVIALLSFVLVFFGMAFLSAQVAESGVDRSVVGFAQALAYAFFVFAFVQMVYIASSVFLATPLGLHAGNPTITVAGTLGLAGGGSRPRALAGIAGFLVGALTRTRSGVKVDRLAIVIAIGLVTLLLLDPLTNGIIFHEFLLLFTFGQAQGQAALSTDFLGGFLFNIGDAFGNLASQWYFIQRGLILYFAGAVAFVLSPKLQKTTGTILLLFSAVVAGNGIVRVADMIPMKTMASTIPGFMTALLVVPMFIMLSSLERFVRKRIS